VNGALDCCWRRKGERVDICRVANGLIMTRRAIGFAALKTPFGISATVLRMLYEVAGPIRRLSIETFVGLRSCKNSGRIGFGDWTISDCRLDLAQHARRQSKGIYSHVEIFLALFEVALGFACEEGGSSASAAQIPSKAHSTR